MALTSGNHWTVFNGAGAVVCDNMPLDVVHAYLTPERFARGWHAAYCLVVHTEDDLAEVSGDIGERQMQDQEQPDDDEDGDYYSEEAADIAESRARNGSKP